MYVTELINVDFDILDLNRGALICQCPMLSSPQTSTRIQNLLPLTVPFLSLKGWVFEGPVSQRRTHQQCSDLPLIKKHEFKKKCVNSTIHTLRALKARKTKMKSIFVCNKMYHCKLHFDTIIELPKSFKAILEAAKTSSKPTITSPTKIHFLFLPIPSTKLPNGSEVDY